MSEREMLIALLDSCLDEPEPGDCARGTDLADDILNSGWLAAHNEERDALRAWKVNAQITLDYDKVQLDALASVIEATKAALNAEEDTHEVPDVNEWADAYRVENALKVLSSYQEAQK